MSLKGMKYTERGTYTCISNNQYTSVLSTKLDLRCVRILFLMSFVHWWLYRFLSFDSEFFYRIRSYADELHIVLHFIECHNTLQESFLTTMFKPDWIYFDNFALFWFISANALLSHILQLLTQELLQPHILIDQIQKKKVSY